MNAKDYVTRTIEHHIEVLEERLKKIYKVPADSEFFSDNKPEDFDLRERIADWEILESIYSVIDNEDIKYSPTSKEYGGYLKNIRKALVVLNSDKEKIESKNEKEIKNINLLLNKLYEEKNEINE